MTKWQYLALIVEMYPMIEFQGQLNELGKEGWELVAIMEAPDAPDIREKHSRSARAFFKRPAPPSN